MFVDYELFHQQQTNSSKNKISFTPAQSNFQVFQDWDLAFPRSQQKSVFFQGFKDFFKGSKKKRCKRCFKGSRNSKVAGHHAHIYHEWY